MSWMDDEPATLDDLRDELKKLDKSVRKLAKAVEEAGRPGKAPEMAAEGLTRLVDGWGDPWELNREGTWDEVTRSGVRGVVGCSLDCVRDNYGLRVGPHECLEGCGCGCADRG